MSKWREAVVQHCRENKNYTQRDFVEHFSDPEAQEGLKQFIRMNSHKPMREFSGTSNDYQALVAPAFQSVIAEYGLIADLPDNLITVVPEDRESVTKRFVWKAEGIEDYLEGEPFKETYFEAGTNVVRWRKPGAKIVNTYEAIKDIPLDVVQINLRLTLNEFKAREWKHFLHELHKGTSNLFPMNATDKHGNSLQTGTNAIDGWRAFYDNALGDALQEVTWADIKLGRKKMATRERDAVMPDTLIMNASTESDLSDDSRVNQANIYGSANTHFATGQMPRVYGIQNFIVVPDSYFGYFADDTARKSADFVPTNDVFLLTTQNGPTVMRHTREPLSTETWRIYDGQREALNLWERYDYGIFRYTNILRIPTLNGSSSLE